MISATTNVIVTPTLEMKLYLVSTELALKGGGSQSHQTPHQTAVALWREKNEESVPPAPVCFHRISFKINVARHSGNETVVIADVHSEQLGSGHRAQRKFEGP
jgi:hypothetical protein